MLVNDPSLTPQEQRLRDLMSEISEASHSAGWMLDTEFEVWRLATEGGVWGRSTAAELQQLLEEASGLAQKLGKWIVWRDGPDSDTRAIDLAEWRRLYADWRATQS
jgi:hypothetical protein